MNDEYAVPTIIDSNTSIGFINFINSGYQPQEVFEIRYEANVFLQNSNTPLHEEIDSLKQQIQELTFKLEQVTLKKVEEEVLQFKGEEDEGLG